MTEGQTFVYDPLEHRQWGPFDTDEAANKFIEDDKYLSSVAVVTVDARFRPSPATYRPEEYK